MDLEDDLGIDLEEDEGNDSMEEEEDEEEEEEIATQGTRDSESAMEDHSDWIANRFEEDDGSLVLPNLDDISVQLGPDFTASDNSVASTNDTNS